jgi:C_GCAxxG_C_C family probable redox protein
VKDRAETAVSCFNDGFSCSQAILSTYAGDFGLDRDTALRIGEGFVGGIACLGGTCGSVIGAIMVIGLRYGRTRVGDRKAQATTVRAVREFVRRFEARNGTTTCNELLGCKIDTPEKENRAKKKGLFSTICPKTVRDAVEILEELLADQRG